nr:vegetative cell wall protein gp1-like [Lolium perenne]
MTEDCIGAIDGTHVTTKVPRSMSEAFCGRKHYTSQNVLAAVDFYMRFTYLLAGWAGSAHDASILADSLSRPDGLQIPWGVPLRARGRPGNSSPSPSVEAPPSLSSSSSGCPHPPQDRRHPRRSTPSSRPSSSRKLVPVPPPAPALAAGARPRSRRPPSPPAPAPAAGASPAAGARPRRRRPPSHAAPISDTCCSTLRSPVFFLLSCDVHVYGKSVS